ncbi:MAG: GGDEF domain-containing protein, partial [Bdellovibrionota bacterium]
MSNVSKQHIQRAHRDQLASQVIEQLEDEVSKVMTLLTSLKGRVTRDDLTGLLRRNEFFRQLDAMVAPRSGDVAMILIDIDDFKRINDLEGHVVGDHVLQRVSRVIQRCLKAGAEVGRFGGEEFVLAICAGPERAGILAEALRRQIQREVNVTVSVGVATAKTAEWDVRKMVGLADKALYQAKHAGK